MKTWARSQQVKIIPRISRTFTSSLKLERLVLPSCDLIMWLHHVTSSCDTMWITSNPGAVGADAAGGAGADLPDLQHLSVGSWRKDAKLRHVCYLVPGRSHAGLLWRFGVFVMEVCSDYCVTVVSTPVFTVQTAGARRCTSSAPHSSRAPTCWRWSSSRQETHVSLVPNQTEVWWVRQEFIGDTLCVCFTAGRLQRAKLSDSVQQHWTNAEGVWSLDLDPNDLFLPVVRFSRTTFFFFALCPVSRWSFPPWISYSTLKPCSPP